MGKFGSNLLDEFNGIFDREQLESRSGAKLRRSGSIETQVYDKLFSSSAREIASSIPQLRLKALQKMWFMKVQILDMRLGDKDA